MILLALGGLAIAYRPVAAMLQIATGTFTGRAVLFPVTLAMVYWRRTNAWAGFTSIVVGEAMVVLYHFRFLPTFGLLPVIPLIAVVTFVLVAGSLLAPATRPATPDSPLSALPPVTARGRRWVAVFGFGLLLGNDFWAWHRPQASSILNLPAWLWYHIGLCLLLFGLLVIAFRERKQVTPAV